MTRNLPLAGFRILSAEQYGAGPYGTMFLAQLGAEVIKIEQPGSGDERLRRGIGHQATGRQWTDATLHGTGAF